MALLHKRISLLQPFTTAPSGCCCGSENLSYEEIGQIVGISAKNKVRVPLYRIREQLKQSNKVTK